MPISNSTLGGGMWGSIAALETLASVAFWIGVIAGGTALMAGAALTVTSDRISALTKAEADLRISEADERAAQANLQAAQARRETAAIWEKIAWRRVSAQQREALVAALKGQTFEVWTSFVEDDPESTVFRNDLDAALTEAGLKTKYFSGWAKAVGLQITGPESADKSTLAAALSAAGLPFHLGDGAKFAKDDLVIIVGTKPEP